jgi:hypothetical protein
MASAGGASRSISTWCGATGLAGARSTVEHLRRAPDRLVAPPSPHHVGRRRRHLTLDHRPSQGCAAPARCRSIFEVSWNGNPATMIQHPSLWRRLSTGRLWTRGGREQSPKATDQPKATGWPPRSLQAAGSPTRRRLSTCHRASCTAFRHRPVVELDSLMMHAVAVTSSPASSTGSPRR